MMKNLLKFILLTIFALNCSQTKQNPIIKTAEKLESKNDKILGEKHINNDFLKYVNPDKKDSLKTEILQSFMIYDEDTYKFVQIDAEELTEYNFDFFLPKLNKILAKRNINLKVEITKDYQKTNDILINNEKLNLYTAEELNNNTFWETAPKNFFRRLNEILHSTNSDETFYLLYQGNDLATFLLTKINMK